MANFRGLGRFDDPALLQTPPPDPTRWQVARAAAVTKAEAMSERFNDDYAWAFVDKDSPGPYGRRLATEWGAQMAISGVLFAGIVVSLGRRRQS